MGSDTVVAIATAPGAAGVGVLRLSGPGAVEAVQPLFFAADGVPLGAQPARRLALGSLRRPSGELLDEVLVVRFQAPHSFTGETVVEIHAHGGDFHLREILGALVRSAAATPAALRIARPGEFTQRAFLNGKMDLTRAEAVADLIASSTALAREAAVRQLGGGLNRLVESLRGDLVGLAAECEAVCDFPDEAGQAINPADFSRRIGALVGRLDGLLEGAGTARLIRQGVRVALVGPANAGKSSLLNALCGQERAIVSPEAGTTRDWLEARLDVDGLAVVLYDTAGLREHPGPVEAEGARRARGIAAEADVVVLVLDRSGPLEAGAMDVLAGCGTWLVALNKADLACEWPRSEVLGRLGALGVGVRDGAVLDVSARTGEGVGALKRLLRSVALGGRALEGMELVALTQARHEAAAREARDALAAARRACDSTAGWELVALDVRAALDALGEIVGAVPRSRILEEIFGRFCVGK